MQPLTEFSRGQYETQIALLTEDRDRLLLALADAAGAHADQTHTILDHALNFRGAAVGEIRARLGRPGYVPPVDVRDRKAPPERPA